MLFGHTYQVRAKVELTDGRVAKVKTTVEARLFTGDELKDFVTKYIRKEVLFSQGIPVKNFLMLDIF